MSIPLLLAVGVAMLAVFVMLQRRRQRGQREPLGALRAVRRPQLHADDDRRRGIQLCLGGVFLPFTIYLQSVLGLTALQAGLV